MSGHCPTRTVGEAGRRTRTHPPLRATAVAQVRIDFLLPGFSESMVSITGLGGRFA
jgi:hypothetical protein